MLDVISENLKDLEIKIRRDGNQIYEILFDGNLNPENITRLKASSAMAEILRHLSNELLVINFSNVSEISIAFLDILAEISTYAKGLKLIIDTSGNDYIYYRTKKLFFDNFGRIIN